MKKMTQPGSPMRRAVAALLAAMLWGATILPASAGTSHTIKVDGLACPFCAYGIEKQLRAIPGVNRVKVSIKSGTVIVSLRDGAELTRARAARAVKDAGFSMRSFK